jgi:Fe-S-cluster-containing hydrogenase component 2
MDQRICLRREDQDCRRCIEICPTNEKALRIDAQGLIEVVAQQCIGCGQCQSVCPTIPKAIAVQAS